METTELLPGERWYLPHFVLFEDGLVLYRAAPPNAAQLVQAQVPPDAAHRIVEDVLNDGFRAVPFYEFVTKATDQPEAAILVRDESQWRGARVNGLDRFGNVTSTQIAEPPGAFVRTLRRLSAFSVPHTGPWIADNYEVVIALNEEPQRWSVAKPWPTDLPPPVIADDRKNRVVKRYPGNVEAAVSAAEQQLGVPGFVRLDERIWRFHWWRVIPESDYIDRVWKELFEKNSK